MKMSVSAKTTKWPTKRDVGKFAPSRRCHGLCRPHHKYELGQAVLCESIEDIGRLMNEILVTNYYLTS